MCSLNCGAVHHQIFAFHATENIGSIQIIDNIRFYNSDKFCLYKIGCAWFGFVWFELNNSGLFNFGWLGVDKM